MKAKYIFRGFGLGVIITAVIMSVYTRSAVADARVNVLKEYGIGEEAVLAETLVDVDGNDDGDAQKESTDDNVEIVPFDEEPKVQESESDAESTLQDEMTPGSVSGLEVVIQGDVVDDESTQAPGSVIVVEPSDERDTAEAADTVTVVISPGDSSDMVARKLHSAGLVENAKEFDAFLIQHGYGKKMRAGTKNIKKDASWQEIADQISQ